MSQDATPHTVDEHEDELPCYRHPTERTALRCLSCERPICVDCAITAPVGIKCPDCGRQSRAALAKVPTDKIVRGAVAAGAAGAAAGFLFAFLRGGFFSLIIAYVLGMGIGEIARRASGGFRDHTLARIAAAAALLGLLWPLVLDLVAGGAFGSGDAFWLLGGVVAAYAAFTRVT